VPHVDENVSVDYFHPLTSGNYTMAEVDDAGGLFCIAISEDEEEPSKEKRNELSEEAFEALKASYTPLIENGEVRT
jgi:hypothetical protein